MIKAFPNIPNYRIEKKLGEGGMAVVYQGIQEKLERTVAIKVLKNHYLKDENFAKRFLKEAETAANLIHPNIVTIYDVGEADGILYIVMELLNDSLKDRIKQMIYNGSNYKVSLEPGETMVETVNSVFEKEQNSDGTFYGFKKSSDIIIDISSALDYAHKEGFIHRDIKPDNILFRKDDTPVLVDFGIARPVHSTTGMTTEGVIIGTPHYMSPEQCLGESVDHRSDYYSLGVVYYELLTGKVPYKADSATAVLVKHIKNPIPKLQNELQIIQPFINKLMAKNKSERISNNAELNKIFESTKSEFEKTLVRKKSIRNQSNNDWKFKDEEINKSKDVEINIVDMDELETDASTGGLKLFFMVTFLAIVVTAYFMFIYKSSNDRENIEYNKSIIKKTDKKKLKEKLKKNIGEERKREKSLIAKNERDEKLKKYIILAKEYLSKKNFDMAFEKINLAKKIYNSKEVLSLENEIRNQKKIEIELKKDEAYNKLIITAKEDLKNKRYKMAYENLRSAALIKETKEVKELVDIVIKEEKIALERKKAIEKKNRENRLKDIRAYKRAKSINKVYGYETYIKRFPKGRFKKEAKRRIEDLRNAIIIEEIGKDNIAFEKAKQKGTLSSYEKYIENYRTGRFISEAKKKISELKEKIRRETKIIFSVEYIKFFNREIGKPGNFSDRKYSIDFNKSETNYIFTEVKLVNKFYKIDDFSTKIYISYKNLKTNQIFKTKVKTIYQRKDLSNFIYSTGMGWKEKGKWIKGKYLVSIFVEEKLIGKKVFNLK